MEIYDSSLINKKFLLTELTCQEKNLSSMCKTKNTIWSKTLQLIQLLPTTALLSVSSKTKRRWAGTGKAHCNVWHTPLLKEAMNTTINKRAAYTTHGKLWEKRKIKWKYDSILAVFLSEKICNYTIKKNKKTWTDYRNKTEKK